MQVRLPPEIVLGHRLSPGGIKRKENHEKDLRSTKKEEKNLDAGYKEDHTRSTEQATTARLSRAA
jgi:hypothetical protein